MCGARAADGLQLGVGEDATGHEVLREQRAVVAFGRRGRRHCGRLDQARRVGAGAGDPDALAVGVEDARRKGIGLCRGLGGLDRQRLGVLERPSGHGVEPRCRQRPLARRRGNQGDDAGSRRRRRREEGEEVELFDRGVDRSDGDVRCSKGHGISGWHEVQSLYAGSFPGGLRPAALTGSPHGPASRRAVLLAEPDAPLAARSTGSCARTSDPAVADGSSTGRLRRRRYTRCPSPSGRRSRRVADTWPPRRSRWRRLNAQRTWPTHRVQSHSSKPKSVSIGASARPAPPPAPCRRTHERSRTTGTPPGRRPNRGDHDRLAAARRALDLCGAVARRRADVAVALEAVAAAGGFGHGGTRGVPALEDGESA